MPRSTLFWDVDTQADFIYPEGKLYVPGAETIVPNLKRITDWASAHGILIVASACAHKMGDPEFQQYPPHCLVGTPGQEKIPQTCRAGALVVPNRPVPLPADLFAYPQIILEKQQLDVFSNPNTEALLAQLGGIREIVVYGVVTEICVAYAARGLIQRGYAVSVVADAIRHLDQSQAQLWLKEVVNSGAELLASDDVLTREQQRVA